MSTKLKVGQLVYTKNVGYPFNRTDNGGETWEGTCCRVVGLKAGATKDMVDVEPLFPIKTPHGEMTRCLFWPEQVHPEDRPWLKRHLKDIMKLKAKLREVATMAEKMT